MVITARRVPDHSTIAEFRRRHETALAGLFTQVLGLCRKAGLVRVGIVAIDGTKVSAHASMDSNRSFEQIAREILADAAETDQLEDELHGDARGDELPEQLCTHEGRRSALRDAKRELAAEQAEQETEEHRSELVAPIVAIDLDVSRSSTASRAGAAGSARAAGSLMSCAASRRVRSRAPGRSGCWSH